MIISLVLYSICPLSLLLVSLYGFLFNKKRWRYYLAFFIVVIMYISYAYVPQGTPDLVRYYHILDRYYQVPFLQLFSVDNSSVYLQQIIYWLISQSRCYGLLPALTAGLVYGTAGYITCDIAERKGNMRYVPFLLLLQFLMLPYVSIINNIRNVSAFSLVVLATYRDLIQRKNGFFTIFLYIAPIFIHNAAISFVLIRIISFYSRTHKFISCLITLFAANIIELLHRINNLFIRIRPLYNAIEKAYLYSSDEYATSDTYAQTVMNSSWHSMNRWICLLFAFILIIYIWLKLRKNVKFDEKTDQFISFIVLECILVISCRFFAAPHYWRYTVALVLCLGALFILLPPDKNSVTGIIYYGVISLCFAFFIVQAYRFNSYGILSEWFDNIVMNAPISRFIELFSNNYI